MRRFRARGNGLSLSVLEIVPSGAARATCVVLHGFADAAASFDLVAPALGATGLRVLLPDLRGFGDSDRVSGGGYYHFPDYVADVDALVREHVREDEPLFVVGHSMGGTVATLFAGARAERVTRLALLEGVGPPDNAPSAAPLRMRQWLEQLASPPLRQPMTEEDALRRLVASHPRVPREVLATRLPLLARRVDGPAEGGTSRTPDVDGPAEGGTSRTPDVDGPARLGWRFDPLHRTTSPMPFFADVLRAHAARVSCPVLYVSGGPLGWRVPDEAARLAAFADVAHVDLPDAGHMMHWTKPAELAEELTKFFSPTGSRSSSRR